MLLLYLGRRVVPILDKLIFYCHFGSGDIFESREFVKEIASIIPAKECYYAHGKSLRLLLDIPNLKYTQLTSMMNVRMPFIKMDENVLMINTWIGRGRGYVLPGIGCTVEALYRMYNDTLLALHYRKLDKPIMNYIPSISYAYYKVDGINRFVSTNRRKILIDNGEVTSKQAYNFDFFPIIERLVIKYPKIDFVVTHKINLIESNLFATDEIIGSNVCDLNEISYLSLFCDTLIGRNSGPHVFAQVKENWMDETKALLSFTYTKEGASFVLNQPVKMGKYWSNVTDTESVFEVCKKVIER